MRAFVSFQSRIAVSKVLSGFSSSVPVCAGSWTVRRGGGRDSVDSQLKGVDFLT